MSLRLCVQSTQDANASTGQCGVMVDSGKNDSPDSGKKNAIQGKIRGADSGNTKRWFREKNWRFRETRGTRFGEISKAGFREKNRTFNEIQVSLTNTSYEREASLNHGGKARSADGPKSAARHGRRSALNRRQGTVDGRPARHGRFFKPSPTHHMRGRRP